MKSPGGHPPIRHRSAQRRKFSAEDKKRILDEAERAAGHGGIIFDNDIVVMAPGLKELGRGRALVVQSYVDFMQESDVTDYTESNHFVHARERFEVGNVWLPTQDAESPPFG